MLRTEKRMRLCRCLLVLNLLFIWGNSMLPGSVSGAISQLVRDLLSWLLSMHKKTGAFSTAAGLFGGKCGRNHPVFCAELWPKRDRCAH